MEISYKDVAPHPLFLEALFAFKSKVSSVFSDVLGLHEINHIAITRISLLHEILTFSSTPAMEFNLFNSNLWRFDKTFHPEWFHTCSQADWQSLYHLERYDELYYIKQLKHRYSIGYSLAAKQEGNFYIYSMASNCSCKTSQEHFAHRYEEFYKIGQYCSNILAPLFLTYDRMDSERDQRQVDYETSN